jgi:myosin III
MKQIAFCFYVLQLCGGGSVTDLVQGLKKRGQVLTTDQIGYILHETVQVRSKHKMHKCRARREQACILAPG